MADMADIADIADIIPEVEADGDGIQYQIDRLTDAKAAIKTAIKNKGVTVSDSALLGEYANLIAAIVTTPSLQSKIATPGATAQTITPDTGYDGLSEVLVNGDADLTAANIKSGVSIFGVTGTYEGSGAGNVSVESLTYYGEDISQGEKVDTFLTPRTKLFCYVKTDGGNNAPSTSPGNYTAYLVVAMRTATSDPTPITGEIVSATFTLFTVCYNDYNNAFECSSFTTYNAAASAPETYLDGTLYGNYDVITITD